MPKAVVKVPKLNGFDKSFKHLLTSKVGTLTPVLVDELPANTKVHLSSALQAQLPPLATDTFMRVNLKMEAFFVPSRLLYGGYTQWLTKEVLHIPTQPNVDLYARIPSLKRVAAGDAPMAAAGTLLDYLGCHTETDATAGEYYFNIFPLLAYHRIWDDWYRNPNVQTPCFCKPLLSASGGNIRVYNLPYITIDSTDTTPRPFYTPDAKLADGVTLGALRQRNFGYDYFTNAMPSPQRGSAQKVEINTSDNTFTIAALRAANSLQQFAERNELAGPRWQDYLKANYNADLSSGVAQRALYLGSGELAVYNKSVYQTAPIGGGITSTNPFGNSGAPGSAAKFGDAQANGQIKLIDDFTTNEPGYLMVIASLVPVVTYGQGINRMFFRNNSDDAQSDLATPILQNVGNQPIYAGELNGQFDLNVFGYTDRYADFKYKNDELSGLVRDGSSLQAFALQRVIDGNPEISDEFLQIPTDYMDNVTNVTSWLSQYGYWLDAYFDYKIAMPLDGYSLPSLQDPAYEHGDSVTIDTNGSQIR